MPRDASRSRGEVVEQPARRGDAIRRGVAHVPEDRTGVGSAPNLSIADNLIMKRYREPPIARGWFIDDSAATRIGARSLKDEYAIAAPVDRHAGAAPVGRQPPAPHPRPRDRDRSRRCMVAVQPTRGLDVGAIEAVHRLLLDRREAGAAILLISEDLDEILALADRIDVMYEGRIVGHVRRRRRRTSTRSAC